VEGGDSATEVPRFPADVLYREVDSERRGPIRRQLELARRKDEVLGAVGGLERVVRQREVRDRRAHLALADGQLGVGVQWDVVAARRERQARRAPARSVEVGPLSWSYVTKPSRAAAASCVSGVTASAPERSGAIHRHDGSPFAYALKGKTLGSTENHRGTEPVADRPPRSSVTGLKVTAGRGARRCCERSGRPLLVRYRLT
jgi:hypothetical protein